MQPVKMQNGEIVARYTIPGARPDQVVDRLVRQQMAETGEDYAACFELCKRLFPSEFSEYASLTWSR